MDKPSWYPEGTLAEPFVPQDVSNATMAFPGSVAHLMPPVAAIPEEFANMNAWRSSAWGGGADHWIRFQESWFYKGMDAEGIKVKKGVDKDAALRHLSAIQGSFQPKHEYKTAAVAYLASLWFEDWRESK